MRNFYHLISLFVLVIGVSVNAFGATLTGKVAVGDGKGTAKVETLNNNDQVQKTASTTTKQQVTATMTVNGGGLFGIGATQGKTRFTATAAAGYHFDAWYTNAGCTDGKQTANAYTTGTTTANRTDEYWAKFIANSYSIVFNGNGANAGDMSNAGMSMTYDAPKNLSLNAYEYKYNLSYSLHGGTIDEDAEQVIAYSFKGWATTANGAVSFADGEEVNIATENSATVNLFAVWEGSNIITLPTPTKAGNVLEGWFIGDTKIGDAGDTYTITQDVTITAHWIERYPFTMSGSNYELLVGETQGNAFTFTYAENPTIHFAPEGIVSYDNASNSLTALAEGTTTIYFTQDQTETIMAGESEHWTVAVSRVENTLSLSKTAAEQFVGDIVEGIIGTKNSDAAVQTSSTAEGIARYDVASDSIIIDNYAEAAFEDTVVTISIWQDENVKYAASGEKTFTLTVKKYKPVFTLSTNALELDETANLTLTNVDGAEVTIAPERILSYENGVVTAIGLGEATITVTQPETKSISAKQEDFPVSVSKKTATIEIRLNNTVQNSISVPQDMSTPISVAATSNSDAAVVIEQLSGMDIVKYADGIATASMGTGTAIFRAIVAETDTYKADTAEFRIVVAKNANHLPITNNDGISLEGGALNAFNWNDKNSTISFEGVPDKLTFKYRYSSDATTLNSPLGGNNTYMMYVEQSPDNTNWEKIWDNSQPETTATSSNEIPLNKDTRYVKFHFCGNFNGYFTEINISELKYVEEPSVDTLDLGTASINSGEVSRTAMINWCNIAPLAVSSSNPKFIVTPSSFGDFESYGSQELQVSYVHGSDVEAQEGDITISNGNPAYTKTIHVRAETTKYPQNIMWNAKLEATGFAMNVGEQYPDAEIETIATASNNGLVTYTSADTSVIRVSEDGLLLTALKEGVAEITATQAGDEDYQSVTVSQLFRVTNKLKQTISWEQNLRTLLTTDNYVVLTATASSGGDITYSSDDESVVRVSNDTLFVVGEGKTIITAKQDGDTINGKDYLSIEQTNYVIVRDPAAQCDVQALYVNSLTLSSNNLSQEYPLKGVPGALTFTAQHGTKNGTFIGYQPVYSSLIVEQWAYINDLWDWHKVYDEVVATAPNTTSPKLENIHVTATKIRFRTTETGTTHTISNITIPRAKFLSADVDSINTNIVSNAEWNQKITVSHSSIDLMSVESKKGLLTLSSSTLGEGCDSYGDDILTVSFTPMDKYKEYVDTIVISDGKADPSTIIIPVRLYSRGLNQLINTFNLPEACVATDTVNVSATASSELEVTFISSDSTIAYVNNGQLVILSSGTVSITARQEGNEKYDAAEQTKTIVISKAETSVITAPTASEITYGEALSASELIDGAGSVAGSFAWAEGTKELNAGAHTEIVIFTPTDIARYSTSTIEVEVIVAKAASSAEAPVAVENLVYNGEAQTLVAAGTANGGEMQYSLDGENWSAELPQATDAGAYAVYYKVAGDANHNDYVAEEPVKVVIDYTIAYELDGGNVETANPTHYNAETETFTLANPTKEHYTFDGWTGSNGEEPQTEVTIAQGTTGNLSFVANWKFIKQNQTIVWEQELGTVEVDDNTLQMQADASSWLNIYYISSDSTIAYVDADNYVVALKAGEVTITAHQDGNDTYNAAEPVSKTLTVVDKDNQGGSDATAVENVNGDKANGEWTKVLRNNQIFIIRGSKAYTVQGQRVE